MSSRKKIVIGIGAFVVLIVVALVWVFSSDKVPPLVNQPANSLERARMNYGDEVQEIAEDKDLPYEYFMALIVLECSGNKPSGERFENHVYNKLKDVKEGSRRKHENIKQGDIADATDQALRNLATSWGPFQLMGYKCIGLDVNVKDIRGEEAVLHGMKWIEIEYGDLLSKEKFKDAFHYHNTGRKYPKVGGSKTHDPKYVEKGLAYMEYFRAE